MTEELKLNGSMLKDFKAYLISEEKSQNTTEKYLRDVLGFFNFLASDKEVNKLIVTKYKELLPQRYAITSANSVIAAINNFLGWLGFSNLKIKPFKVQREIFANPQRELSMGDYHRLIKAASKKKSKRLSLIIQTICSTGIRVSELRGITFDSIQKGRCTVSCKGKSRTVLLPKDLCSELKKYCRQSNILGGVIFTTKTGKPIDRSNIWKDMKGLCCLAGISPSKVFPHNLRHLFARSYYKIEKDISRLADLLGHSSVNTTRIYIMESGNTHEKQIHRLGLVPGWQ